MDVIYLHLKRDTVQSASHNMIIQLFTTICALITSHVVHYVTIDWAIKIICFKNTASIIILYAINIGANLLVISCFPDIQKIILNCFFWFQGLYLVWFFVYSFEKEMQ